MTSAPANLKSPQTHSERLAGKVAPRTRNSPCAVVRSSPATVPRSTSERSIQLAMQAHPYAAVNFSSVQCSGPEPRMWLLNNDVARCVRRLSVSVRTCCSVADEESITCLDETEITDFASSPCFQQVQGCVPRCHDGVDTVLCRFRVHAQTDQIPSKLLTEEVTLRHVFRIA